MTTEQYDKANEILNEIHKLRKVLYGSTGSCGIIRIEGLIVSHQDANKGADVVTSTFCMSKELSNDIIDTIKNRIHRLGKQLNNL